MLPLSLLARGKASCAVSENRCPEHPSRCVPPPGNPCARKSARRRILFIDIDRTDIPTPDSHAHEPAPETAPEQRRIDEQHLYLLRPDAHKGRRTSGALHDRQSRRTDYGRPHGRHQPLNILIRQKSVAPRDRLAPQCNHPPTSLSSLRGSTLNTVSSINISRKTPRMRSLNRLSTAKYTTSLRNGFDFFVYLAAPNILRHDKLQKKFAFALAYSYICRCNDLIYNCNTQLRDA